MIDNVRHIGEYLARKEGTDRGVEAWKKPKRVQVGPGRYRFVVGENLRWYLILERITYLAERNPELAWYRIKRLGMLGRGMMPEAVRSLYDATQGYCAYAMDRKREWEEMEEEVNERKDN